MGYGSSYSPANPGFTYSIQGIYVSASDFMNFVGIALQDPLTMMEWFARTNSAKRIGKRNTGVSWGRPFEVIYDVNDNMVSTKWGKFEPGLKEVNYGTMSWIYGNEGIPDLSLLPQTPTRISLTTDEVNTLLSELTTLVDKPDCAKFIESVLSQLKTDTGRQQHGTTDVLKLFQAVQNGRGFDWQADLKDQAAGGGGPGFASITINPSNEFANLTNKSPGFIVNRARLLVHELFHVAGYDHDAMARAAYNLGERFDSSWKAWKGDFPDPQNDELFSGPDKNKRLDGAYAGFFLNVLQQHCK